MGSSLFLTGGGAAGIPWGPPLIVFICFVGGTGFSGGAAFSGATFLNGAGGDGFTLLLTEEPAFFNSVLSDSCLSPSDVGVGTPPGPLGGGWGTVATEGGGSTVIGVVAVAPKTPFPSLDFLSAD